jgi:hypothetical protein
MNGVANLPVEDRRALFEETAARMGLASPVVTEKDFWVCWTLSRLYAIPGLPRLLFKGGTSLSKCFGVIHRFSEDIDLGIERADLDLADDQDPSKHTSRKQWQRAVKALGAKVGVYVRDGLLPKLERDFEERLGEPFRLRLGEPGGESDLFFEYPQALGDGTYVDRGYVAPVVKLELGARSDHHPVREVSIRSYAADAFPAEFRSPSCSVVAQAPERTLLEKALILHTGSRKGRFSRNSSRHAYDLVMLARGDVVAGLSRELFEDVARHKLVFSDDKEASLAPEDGACLVPTGDALRALETDYRAMEPMFFSVPAPPSFDEVIEGLRGLEGVINAL